MSSMLNALKTFVFTPIKAAAAEDLPFGFNYLFIPFCLVSIAMASSRRMTVALFAVIGLVMIAVAGWPFETPGKFTILFLFCTIACGIASFVDPSIFQDPNKPESGKPSRRARICRALKAAIVVPPLFVLQGFVVCIAVLPLVGLLAALMATGSLLPFIAAAGLLAIAAFSWHCMSKKPTDSI